MDNQTKGNTVSLGDENKFSKQDPSYQPLNKDSLCKNFLDFRFVIN